jgi:hypothetical protein
MARERAGWLAAWLGIAIVTVLAIYRIRDFPAHLSWINAFEGIRSVLPITAWAAIKVWFFWGWSAAIIGGVALRLAPGLDAADAILIGAAGPWVIAYIIGNLLGPIGLFVAPLFWALLAAGTVWLWRNPPRLRSRPWTAGQKLAALALAILAVAYLPLQLGSPVVPFMDVLSYPSSAERIVAFRTYLPFDNDPYGCWGPYAQTPALELFYAMLAMGSHTRLAVLAESAAMLPMAALMIFATYRIGKTFFSDTAGGMAALVLLLTTIFRRAQGMRGTAVDFALVALGLAFTFDRSRHRVLLAIGAVMLGTAVASHAIDGVFALIVAGVGVGFLLVATDYRRASATLGCLAGASLIAIPEIAIGFAHPLPYAVLPLPIIAGVALASWSAARLGPASMPAVLPDPASRNPGSQRLRILNVALIALFIFAVIYRRIVEPYSLFAVVARNLPILSALCFAGLVAAIAVLWRQGAPQMPFAALAAVALAIGIAGEYLDPVLQALSNDPASAMITSDLHTKLWEYWCPYFLTLPAGFLFALAYERWWRPAVFFVLMTILIYPWFHVNEPVDYDANEYSIVEQWAFDLSTAADGYWSGQPDRRWTIGPAETRLMRVLDGERQAGLVTPKTHILHLCDSISSWSLVQFPVFTGINDDPIELHHDPNNQWEGGSRVRGFDQLRAALAGKPPYILEQIQAPTWMGDPPSGYIRIFDDGEIRLYRRADLAPATARRS